MVSSFLSSTLYSPDFVVWIAVVVVAEAKVVDSLGTVLVCLYQMMTGLELVPLV